MINVPFVNVANPTAGLQLNSDITVDGVTDSAIGSDEADQIWIWVPSLNGYRHFFRYAGDGATYPAGWCDAEDADWNYIEDTPDFAQGLPLGSAMYYKAKTGTKVITGSGAVEGQDEIEVPLTSGNFTMVGNPYPSVLQLNSANFVANGVSDSSIGSDEADQIWIWVPSLNGYRHFFRYAGDGATYPAGWCDAEDADWNYIEDTPDFGAGIPSGTAMYYKAKIASGKAAVFTSPLAK